MIEIYRPKVNRGRTLCKQCKENIHSAKDRISLDPHNRIMWEHWSFHNECFVQFRSQIKDVNVYTVKEK